MTDHTTPDEIHRAKLNLETSKIAWTELQRYFASGSVLVVAPDVDLIEVGLQMSKDNAAQIKLWLDKKQLAHVSDELAREWLEADTMVWCVVVSPWLLVQHRGEDEKG